MKLTPHASVASNSRSPFTLGDAVACAPLLCFGALMLFGAIAYVQVGHWPSYSQPDPKELSIAGIPVGGFMLMFVLIVAIPLALLALAVVGMTTILHTLGDLADGRWTLCQQRRNATRLVVIAVGSLLFWRHVGPMLNWLFD